MRAGTIVVIGPPGSLTHEVGADLAARTGRPLQDTDRLVEARFGEEVSEIFLEHGENVFRDAEREIAVDLLASVGEAIVVLGGGAVLDPLTEQALRQRGESDATVVFLDVGITDAAKRLGLNAERPSGIGAPRSQWLRMMEVRRPIYRDLASVRILTDDLDVAGVTDQVMESLR